MLVHQIVYGALNTLTGTLSRPTKTRYAKRGDLLSRFFFGDLRSITVRGVDAGTIGCVAPSR